MNRNFAARASWAVVLVLTTVALTPSVAQAADRRIRTLLYDPTQVFPLRGWVGYHIDLEFEPGESFQTLGGGDLGALTYGSFENHLVLKPTASNIRTNLTVITSRRTYIFEYVVDAGSPEPSGDDLVYSFRFSYPTLAVATGNAPGTDRVTQYLKGAETARVQNYDYWFCGDASLQPVEASDDGVHTRLKFSPRAEIPAFFVRNDDGSESLLNFNIDLVHGEVLVHRTVRRLILRRGNLVGCLVNKSYTGAGERMDSGTLSPDVRRETPAVRP